MTCRFGDPIVDGERATIEWLATITSTAGDAETIAGVSLLRFGVDGRVVEQRDVWSAEGGTVDVPHWAR